MNKKVKSKKKKKKLTHGKSSLTGRNMHTKVKTAKGRKLSSTLWLQRQLNDPYVIEAKKKGYPSRSAFKLLELELSDICIYSLDASTILSTPPSPNFSTG